MSCLSVVFRGQDGDYFAELSLLPMCWFHQRTVIAVKNTFLYSLRKDDVIDLSKNVPTLSDRLAEMAAQHEQLHSLQAVRLYHAVMLSDTAVSFWLVLCRHL